MIAAVLLTVVITLTVTALVLALGLLLLTHAPQTAPGAPQSVSTAVVPVNPHLPPSPRYERTEAMAWPDGTQWALQERIDS